MYIVIQNKLGVLLGKKRKGEDVTSIFYIANRALFLIYKCDHIISCLKFSRDSLYYHANVHIS